MQHGWFSSVGVYYANFISLFILQFLLVVVTIVVIGDTWITIIYIVHDNIIQLMAIICRRMSILRCIQYRLNGITKLCRLHQLWRGLRIYITINYKVCGWFWWDTFGIPSPSKAWKEAIFRMQLRINFLCLGTRECLHKWFLKIIGQKGIEDRIHRAVWVA